MTFSGTGAKIRPIAACKGTTCIYGNFDTQGLAKDMYDRYYIGWTDVALPHKFKIGIGGCPNSCMKPSLNDFGIEGHKVPNYNDEECKSCKVCQVEVKCPVNAALRADGAGKMFIDNEACKTCGVCTGACPFKAVKHDTQAMFQIYVGGTWGKKTRMGTPLTNLVTYEEIMEYLEKTLLWYKENGYKKERLGMTIERLGIEAFETAIKNDDLIKRKNKILKMEIKERPHA